MQPWCGLSPSHAHSGSSAVLPLPGQRVCLCAPRTWEGSCASQMLSSDKLVIGNFSTLLFFVKQTTFSRVSLSPFFLYKGGQLLLSFHACLGEGCRIPASNFFQTSCLRLLLLPLARAGNACCITTAEVTTAQQFAWRGTVTCN